MLRMIDPSRFAEEMATYPSFAFPEQTFSKPARQKTNAEATEDQEDEEELPVVLATAA